MAIEIRGWRRCCKCLTWRHRSRFTGICWGFEGESTSKPRGEHFDRALFKLNGVGLMLNTAYQEDARPPAPDPARFAAHEDTGI